MRVAASPCALGSLRRGLRAVARERRWSRRAATVGLPAQQNRQRRRDEPARVGGGDGADEHRERKALQHFAAEQEQREHGHEDGARRDDRPRQRLVEARVDHRLERLAFPGPGVLANAIEDDDHVVHRVADHRQHRRDDVQRHLVVEEHEERERDQHVVERRGDRAEREADTETERHPGRDADHREQRRVNPPSPELGADHRTDDLGADVDDLRKACRFERLDDLRRSLGKIRALLELLGLRQPDHPLLAAGSSNRWTVFSPGSRSTACRTCSSVTGALEPGDDDGAARELDAERDAARRHHDDAGADDQRRERHREPAPPEEIEIGVLENVHSQRSALREPRWPSATLRLHGELQPSSRYSTSPPAGATARARTASWTRMST